MKVGQILSAVIIVVLSISGGIYTQVSGNEPSLGIDLRGGVSVVLVPTNPDDVSAEDLDQAIEIIRSRVDGLGAREPEIARQGDTISVVLPGVDQQQQAVEVIGQTAELRFRPVLADTQVPALAPGGPLPTVPPLDRPTSTLPTAEQAEATNADGGATEPEATAETPPTTTAVDESEGTPSATEAQASGPRRSPAASSSGIRNVAFQQAEVTTPGDDASNLGGAEAVDPDADEPSTEGAPADSDIDPNAVDPNAVDPSAVDPSALAAQSCGAPVLTLPDDDDPDAVVFLPDENGLLVCLGPVFRASEGSTPLTGNALEDARVGQSASGSFTVNPTFKAGADGIDLFNGAAAECNGQLPKCPSGRLAAVLDQEVISAPTIQAATFSRDRVEISGSFDQEGAEALTLQLRFGALPVELETGPVEQISASTGADVLEAGVIAGLLGLAVVAVYLLAYYRLSGLVAIGGLILSGLLLWTIVAWIGEYRGLALTLSGVVGLIVAIGVSADSNIVYFENVKDAYSQGRRVPTAIERAYRNAISTIVKADTVSLLAAVVLWFVTIGQVKGFALFLGLGTLLDLIISWMFMRPALAAMARLKAVQNNPQLLGLPAEDKR